MKLLRTAVIPASLDEVWIFFSDPRNLARITPESMTFDIVSAPDRAIRRGDEIVYRLKIAGIPVRWVSQITEVEERAMFVDVQKSGPYSLWHHRHVFRDTDGGVEMIDDVDYELPFGPAGRLFGSWFVRLQLKRIFDHRASAIGRLFGDDEARGSREERRE